MDKYSHRKYQTMHNSEMALKRKLFYVVLLVLLLLAGFAVYAYRPIVSYVQKRVGNSVSVVARDANEDTKNSPPPVRFEFYTALATGQLRDTPVSHHVQIASHDELERDMSAEVNKKRKP